jgi:hypothetical protein
MFIRDLSVEGIGRFTTSAHVDGFGEGVNVLAAGNEVGKSTLFKAIRACLFCRHDSKTQDIRDLASDGSQLPATVHLTFVQKSRVYSIKKSFLRSPCGVLTEDGREIARGKQADEAVWDILGLRPGSGRTLDDGAFGLLWVGQGSSFTAPVPGAGASSLLRGAIESEVGALVGGERARQVLEMINAELRRYLTSSEQHPKADGPLARAMDEAERWRTVEAEHQAKLATLETHFAELSQRRRRHRELTDPAVGQEFRLQLAEARKAVAEARAAEQEVRRCEAEATAAHRSVENAAQRLTQYRALSARIDANREAEAGFSAQLPEVRAREQDARGAVTRTQEETAAVEKALQELSRREQQLAKLVAAALRAQRKDELAQQLKTAEETATSLRQTDAALAQIEIRPKTVEELDELDRQIVSLDAQLSAAAAQVAVEVNGEGAGQVRIGSMRIKGAYSAPVLGPIKIAVADLAAITVTPAANPRYERRQELEQERSELLRGVGVATVAEAHAALSKRRELEAERRALLTQLQAMQVDDPEAAIGKLKLALAESDAAIAAALADTQRVCLPSTEDIEHERVALAQERALLEARSASLQETRAQHHEALEAAIGERRAIESKLELIHKTIAEDVVHCPDSERSARLAALAQDVTASESAFGTASATLDALKLTAPDGAEVERRNMRCQRLEEALANQNEELRQVERDIGRLTGQIQTVGGEGVGEALAAAHQQLILAKRELTRVQERVATLRLLRDTVSTCLAEGREHYYAPVRRHLRPFLHDVFPGAELELADGFAITGIKRQRAEPFERLSDGTQEQIAVLVRLAMGAMLAERGEPAPIILDDALVYCDDDRIQRMFDALSRAGNNQQIVVLTCRLRSFEPLGGHMLRVRSGVESELMSTV